uniref:Protein kinase domain-containing protein n=1 Tax=Setaria viridis TaxID=4556 RepID=A0A4U6VKH3_SETVI|nr:putative wall-associated receptor kinase-like 16 [Setaria viridis]TKW28703.1 hypothetical protein SEVIR_3G345900v2 [Setaria viridis]
MRMLLLPLLVVALVSPAMATCQKKCGGLKIQYPFGIGRGCYLETEDGNRAFEVTCNSNGTATIEGRHELLSIDVPRGQLRVVSQVKSWCYDAASGSMGVNNVTTYDSTAFRVSGTDNMFTVIGCSMFAFIMMDDGGDHDNPYAMGCLTGCRKGARSLADGSCTSSGGCCQVPIPSSGSIRSFNVDFSDFNTSSVVASFSPPCGYAMLVEKKAFKFKRTYVTTGKLMDAASTKLPMVLDWAVGNQTCQDLRRNKRTAHACVSVNSECVDSKYGTGTGYLCNCSEGYQGNPYLPDGCKDINECEANPQCPHYSICRNTNGSFKCYELKWLLVIGISIAVVLLGTGISFAYTIRAKRRLAAIKRLHFKQHGGYLLFEEMKSRQGQGHSFTLFTKEELEDATNKFDERYVLGRGGNGTVYRGNLKDGRVVAIKRCRVADDERQRREFGKEMLILSQVNHRNIVKIYGCCLEVEVPMLVYQFIPNGTLYELIHRDGDGDGTPPSFPVRLKIAHEAAEGLAYLHSMASPPIIHGDVKSPNILLDDNYTVKVSDFGGSVLAATDNSHLVTLVQGTRGYLDPEYMQTCRLTDKSDVYSFGVVLLELLTRRNALTMAAPEEERSLAAHFLSSMRDGKLDGLLDTWIKDEVRGDVIEMVATLAKRCLEMSGEKRPSMLEVAEELDRIRKLCLVGDDITILVSDN